MANDQTAIDTQKPKTGMADFVRETRREIAKVTWPTRRETMMTTIAIILFALVTGVFFLVVDTGLGYAVSHLLGMTNS
ncbi:MAG: preprotein translocase subunit SecE [Alphaproteobacteria bacterium]|nr:preprotein translocase subunit SecE [Alphaproteobacteria bacterium]